MVGATIDRLRPETRKVRMPSNKGKKSTKSRGMPKKQDRFALFLFRLYGFVASNIGSVVFGVVALIVLLLAGSYYTSYRAERNSEAFRLFYRTQSEPEAERVAMLQEIIDDYPHSKIASLSCYYLAVHYLDQGEYAEAAKLFEHYLREESGSLLTATALESLGFIHETEGRYEEALVRYTQVLQAHPDSLAAKHIQLNIGRCYEQLKQWEAAREAYTEVFVADPRSIWAYEARQRLDAIVPFVLTPALDTPL